MESPKPLKSRHSVSKVEKNRRISAPKVEIKPQEKRKLPSCSVCKLHNDSELEKVPELQSRPKISARSRKLGERAERKFFKQIRSSCDEPGTSISSDVLFQIQEDNLAIIESSSSPSTIQHESTAKTSIYYMSVLDRNNYWMDKKKKKLQEQRRIAAEEEMKECTFVPALYARVSPIYQKYSLARNNTKSKNHLYTNSYSFMSSRVDLESTFLYQPISPFQVKVSYEDICNTRNSPNR